MRTGSHELRNGVGKGGERINVEDGEGVLAVIHAALRENDRNEVDTGGAQEWQRCGCGEELSGGFQYYVGGERIRGY